MMGMQTQTVAVEKKQQLGKLFMPSVVLPFLVTFMANGILILLLSDITVTFFGSASPATIGLAGQLSTVNSAAEAVCAFLIGFLAIKFKHKPLFLTGILFITISAIGNYFAPSFIVMQAFFVLEGIGSVIVSVIGLTLIGDFVPAKNKSKAVGYTVFSFYLSGIIGPPIVGLVTSLGGWRYSFLLYAIPIAIISLMVAYKGIPKKLPTKESTLKVDYVSAFKAVLLNKSAVICLLSQLLLVGSVVGMYVLVFYQSSFGITMAQSVAILTACSATIAVGGVFAGRIIDKIGKKRLTIICFLLDAITLTLVFQMTNLTSALAFNMVHVFFTGMALASLSCLSLDQIPQSRSTMMSVTSLFGKIGNTIAAAVASGVLIIFASYPIAGFVFGGMTFATAGILCLAKEPKTE